MVDTINPNTNEPDSLEGAQAPVQPAAADNRFYGGFDKPDETKINLADSQSAPGTSNATPQAPVASAYQPVQDVSPAQAAEVKHTSYVNRSESTNWRGIIVIAAIGFFATLLVGTGVYFAVSSSNNSKLKLQQTTLDSIKSELATLQKTPDPLELPPSDIPDPVAPTPAPVVETPVVAPIVTPVPVETPQPTVPAETGSGRDGSLG